MVTSLVDLCIKKWINNVWSLGDVGEIDDYLLDKMLPLCSVNQLKYVEGCTKVSHGRDLSPVTDKLWKKFYEARFDNSDEVIEKMRKHNVPFKWKKAYEYKEEEIKAQEQMRRLVLKEYDNGYRGAAYYLPRSRFRDREETNLLNGDGEDYYHYYNNNNNDYDDVEEEEEDDETDVEEEFLERVGRGQVSVEDSEEEQSQMVEVQQEEEEDDKDEYNGYDDDDYHYHYYKGYDEEEDEETNIEEEFLERVGGEVSEEELVEEQIQIEKEEEMEEEEQTRIVEGAEDRDRSDFGQEDGYGDDSYDGGYGDDSYGDDSYAGGYDNDYDCDDGYGDDYGSDDVYY